MKRRTHQEYRRKTRALSLVLVLLLLLPNLVACTTEAETTGTTQATTEAPKTPEEEFLLEMQNLWTACFVDQTVSVVSISLATSMVSSSLGGRIEAETDLSTVVTALREAQVVLTDVRTMTEEDVTKDSLFCDKYIVAYALPREDDETAFEEQYFSFYLDGKQGKITIRDLTRKMEVSTADNSVNAVEIYNLIRNLIN